MKTSNITAYIAWTLPFLCFLAGYFTISLWFPTKELEAPSLVGKNINEVAAILSNLNLNLRILAEKEDADLDRGTIISQIPASQDKIKPHQSMFVVVSKKPAPILMPLLIDQAKEEIVKIVKNLGLHAHYYYVPSTKPKNYCLAQYPQSHKAVDSITPIVYLSAGDDQPVIMPNFKGMLVTDVLEFLQLYPVSYELIHELITDARHECAHCVVIDQRPMPGSILTLNQNKQLHIQLLVN